MGAGWAFNEIKHLQKMGIENIVVLPSDSIGFALKYHAEGIKIIAADVDLMHKPFEILGKIGTLHSIIKHQRPNIVHSHFAGTTAIARLALNSHKDMPLIFQIPGPLHLESFFTRFLDVKTMRKNDYYIATIDYTQRLLVSSGVPKSRVFLSYYGTELSSEQPQRTGRFRNEFELGLNTPLIGMIAYMYPPKRLLGQRTGLKGHEYFIKAIALLLQDYPNLRGVIIGNQWGVGHDYEDYLKRLSREICGEAIIFAGFRSDVKAIYPDIDVAVHPSLSENAGGAVESLLCGVPTVASNVGGLADVVENGITGLTFNPSSSGDIANAVRQILRDPIKAKKMAAVGRNRMIEMFDVQKTADKVKQIYHYILSDTK